VHFFNTSLHNPPNNSLLFLLLLLLLPRDLSIYLSLNLSVMNKFVEMDDGIMAVLRIDS
jgi:hypothetical protein